MPIEKLMKITKSHRYHRRCHWSQDCAERDKHREASKTVGPPVSGSVLASEVATPPPAAMGAFSFSAREMVFQAIDAVRTVNAEGPSLQVSESGDIVVDAAASPAMNGLPALEELERRLAELGYRATHAESPRAFSRGGGGEVP
ncbi:unnamed protein product, partial [Prorocentrum cordatum]